jgi:flagellar basal body-associated protein FliL
MADKKKILITLLVAIIVVMAAILAYTFLIRPSITGYTIEKQNQAIEFAVFSIMQQATTCQPVPLTFGNQTINIMAMGCPGCFQQQQPQQ